MGLRGRAAALAALAVVLAGCGGDSKRDVPAKPASPYHYDASAPLAVQDHGRANGKYPIAVRDVSYAVPGGRVEAYLAVPSVKGRVPAVIYLHGAGEGRERFVLPATWAAGRRAVGMTLTLPSSARGGGERPLAAGVARPPAPHLRRRRRRRPARDRPPQSAARSVDPQPHRARRLEPRRPGRAPSPPASTRGSKRRRADVGRLRAPVSDLRRAGAARRCGRRSAHR